MRYIAHKNETDIQTVKEHSENTAVLAREFSITELKDFIYNIALLHDIGKYQPTFQRRIDGKKIDVPHALCGAKEAEKQFGKSMPTLMMQYCIAGHHSGLHDCGASCDDEDQPTLYGNISKKCEDYSYYKQEFNLKELDLHSVETFVKQNCTSCKQLTEKIDFIIRYCFSCITDADSLDTEEFCNGEKREKLSSNFDASLASLNKIFDEFNPETKLQKSRSQIQKQAYQKACDEGNIFLLDMPTGSGKTLCSLKIALERAKKFNKKRIIYIIPYNSIIDQTASEFEKNFKELNIVRHQSNFSFDEIDDKTEDYKKWAMKSTENWDADFIITTAVQFFESIYKRKRGKLRKLHNMADSVLIFDEAHLMPINYLEPCMVAINNITKILNSDAIFLTATMPNFKELLQDKFKIDTNICELIEDKSLFKNFVKCSYQYKNFEDIETLILDDNSPSRLIIANSKKTVKEIFDKLTGEKYHLSTYMTGVDRKRVIDEIKTSIAKLNEEFGYDDVIPDERKISVVATSLIEAGVDLDFFTVYRECTGLSSVLQSGGRCNREGKRKSGNVIAFEIGTNLSSPEQALTKELMAKYDDINHADCIKEYYDRLFNDKAEAISKNSIYRKGQKPHVINFKTYAENFNIIDDKKYTSIVVAQDDICKDIMEKTKETGKIDARKVQKYVVSIAKWEFDVLLKQGVLDDFGSGVFFLTNNEYYDENIGIKFEAEDIFY